MGISLKGFGKASASGSGASISGLSALPPQAADVRMTAGPTYNVVLGQKGIVTVPNDVSEAAGSTAVTLVRSGIIALGDVTAGTTVRLKTDFAVNGAKNYLVIGALNQSPVNIVLGSDQGTILDVNPQYAGWVKSTSTWYDSQSAYRDYTNDQNGYIEYTFTQSYTNATIQFSTENFKQSNPRYGVIVELI